MAAAVKKAPTRILWMVGTTLPAAATACGLPSAGDVSGGWLAGQLHALHTHTDALSLSVCSVDARVQTVCIGQREDVRYLVLPQARSHAKSETFVNVLRAEAPALLHIWGTEYEAAQHMASAAETLGIPVLVGFQGVMQDCAAQLCSGVPAQYLHSCALQRLINRVVPGHLLDKEQQQFDALAQSEAKLLGRARFVTGRTDFDREAAARLAPNARYFFCGETLRPEFYAESAEQEKAGNMLWHPHDFGGVPVMFLSQGNYPLKNLHTVLRAMPALLRRWPGATLMVAGWPPLEKGPLLRPLIHWMFPYQSWCARLINELGLSEHVQYTGPLNAAEMREAFLGADVFLLPSCSENSPNSLGEAMLLGVPCVASRVGGVPSLAADGREIRFYAPALDADSLAAAVISVLAAPEDAAAMGQNARRRALADHNPETNAQTLLAIYREILSA